MYSGSGLTIEITGWTLGKFYIWAKYKIHACHYTALYQLKEATLCC